MSNQTLVLDGNRLYGAVTYSANNDPQTLTANLSDTSSLSEADVFQPAKPLADSATLTDAIAKLVEMALSDASTLTEARIMNALKVLSDSSTLSDARVLSTNKVISDALVFAETWKTTGTKALSEITTFNQSVYGLRLYGQVHYSNDFNVIAIFLKDGITKEIQRLFSDSLSVGDNSVAIHQTKGFTEFILLKSWLRLDLRKVDPWTAQSATTVIENSLTQYGQAFYGSKLYAATPLVSWKSGAVDSAVWQKAVEITTQQQLYAVPLYGSALYSTQPATTWTKPGSSLEAWTNEDGENNQES